MSEKPVKITDKYKKSAIILFTLLFLLIWLTRPLSIEGLFETLGALTAYVFFGIVVGNIYFLIKKAQRTNWQRFRIIFIVSLVFFVFKLILKFI